MFFVSLSNCNLIVFEIATAIYSTLFTKHEWIVLTDTIRDTMTCFHSLNNKPSTTSSSSFAYFLKCFTKSITFWRKNFINLDTKNNTKCPAAERRKIITVFLSQVKCFSIHHLPLQVVNLKCLKLGLNFVLGFKWVPRFFHMD